MEAPYLNPLYMRLEFDVPPCPHDTIKYAIVDGTSFAYCKDCDRAISAPFDWQADGFLDEGGHA